MRGLVLGVTYMVVSHGCRAAWLRRQDGWGDGVRLVRYVEDCDSPENTLLLGALL